MAQDILHLRLVVDFKLRLVMLNRGIAMDNLRLMVLNRSITMDYLRLMLLNWSMVNLCMMIRCIQGLIWLVIHWSMIGLRLSIHRCMVTITIANFRVD